MALEKKKLKGNKKMTINLIHNYFKKNLIGKISLNYKYKIKKKYLINIKYYY